MDELRQQLMLAHQEQERATLTARLSLELAGVRGNMAKTMHLLRALKVGAVKIEQVVIDGENWNVVDPVNTKAPEEASAPSAE